jgi:hypothetical protein
MTVWMRSRKTVPLKGQHHRYSNNVQIMISSFFLVFNEKLFQAPPALRCLRVSGRTRMRWKAEALLFNDFTTIMSSNVLK